MVSSNKKLTSSQPAARILAAVLNGHGIKDVVISPGSRNAPLIVAIARNDTFRIHTVIDERSAAFVALGIASRTGRPVALVCTSGTALLNYAPAVAEAYYRTVPLIVVSADRPAAWIDQDDSQTIRQFEALENIVNMSVDIDSDYNTPDFVWYTNRQINDAILATTGRRPGPVHINIRLNNPLGELAPVGICPAETRIIDRWCPEATLSEAETDSLAEYLAGKNVLFIAGFGAPVRNIADGMRRLEKCSNVAVFYEAQSNIAGLNDAVGRIDATLAVMNDVELASAAPDVVVTFGGSLVSRMVKKWLRHVPGLEHIHIGIGPRDRSIDVFGCLTRRIEVDPALFIDRLALALERCDGQSTFRATWKAISDRAEAHLRDFVDKAPWCDLWATQRFIERMPRTWDLQVSNGTSIRYVQLARYAGINRIDSNRGVSGIDGSTSTAIGAATASKVPTVLLTGDMSAKYDIGALGLDFIPHDFRMAVLNNGGGDIFRFIGATSGLDEREKYLAMRPTLPLEQLAAAYGFDYIRASSKSEFDTAMPRFVGPTDRPIIFDIDTREADNATVLREFFGTNNTLIR